MYETIFAAFKDAGDAERAAGALLDHGLGADNISLLAPETYSGTRERAVTAVYTEPLTAESSLESDPLLANDYPASNVATGTGVAATGLTAPVVDAVDIAGEPAEYVEGSVHPNRLGDTTYPAERSFSSNPVSDIGGTSFSQSDDTADRLEAIRETEAKDDIDAKSGISTTTGADGAAGAVKGAGLGLGVGIAAALAALAIPGFGLVLGGGALATAAAGAAGATAAGALAGGVEGFLKDQGVPDDVLTHYNDTFMQGGAILAVAPH